MDRPEQAGRYAGLDPHRHDAPKPVLVARPGRRPHMIAGIGEIVWREDGHDPVGAVEHAADVGYQIRSGHDILGFEKNLRLPTVETYVLLELPGDPFRPFGIGAGMGKEEVAVAGRAGLRVRGPAGGTIPRAPRARHIAPSSA